MKEQQITPEQALDFLYRATQNVQAVKAFHDQALQAAMVLQKLIADSQPKQADAKN